MTQSLGITHAVLGTLPDHPFVLTIHGIREDGTQVLVATVDDEKPMFTARILRMLKSRGIVIEGQSLEIDLDEPEVLFLGIRSSMDEDETEWVDLETRFTDGEKSAAAQFAIEFMSFAEEMARLHPRPEEVAPKRYALFSHYRHEASGGWGDFIDAFPTLGEAMATTYWTRPAKHNDTEVHIVDLTTLQEVVGTTLAASEQLSV